MRVQGQSAEEPAFAQLVQTFFQKQSAEFAAKGGVARTHDHFARGDLAQAHAAVLQVFGAGQLVLCLGGLVLFLE
jgi:hypothetical protein